MVPFMAASEITSVVTQAGDAPRAIRRIGDRVARAASVWRAWVLRRRGIEVGQRCRIEPRVRIDPRYASAGRSGQVSIGDGCELSTGAVLDCWGGRIQLGESVFVGPHCVIYGHGGVEVGRGSMLSMHSHILSSEHTVPGRDGRIRDLPDLLRPTFIGEDVWIGAGATILGGVRIGHGCVVGAGAVVTADLPDFSVAVGVPARVIRMRT